MEEYKTYIKHKSLENLIGTVLIAFVVISLFLVGKTLEGKQSLVYGEDLSSLEE